MNKVLIGLVLLFGLFLIAPINVYANNSPTIRIDISNEGNKTIINYDIDYIFTEDNVNRHGIFMALPKIQDGVNYDYTLKNNVIKNGSSEKYDIINEINSFRLRIGDKNVNLEPGQYNYRFSIVTNTVKDYNHKFKYLYDWRDSISNFEIRRDGYSICDQNTCNSSEISENLNQDKPKPNIGIAYLVVFQNYLWALLATLVTWYGVLKKKLTDPLQNKILSTLPHFTPPSDMTPWQVQSLINKGDIDPHDTLASYIFYLNNKGYITITPDKDNKTITLNKLKELPSDLGPEELNRIVELMITDGIENGLLNSKISQTTLDSKLDQHILESNINLYERKPILYPLAVVLIIGTILFILGMLFFDPFQNWLLVGKSVGVFIFFSFYLGLLILFMILKNYQKLNQSGFEKLQESVGYKYYLSYIESEKLDFDNNPEEGAKFYLNSLPYAAQFGILDKFNKFFRSKQFITEYQADNTGLIYGTVYSSTFYSPPSDGGGFGGGGGGFDGGGGSW